MTRGDGSRRLLSRLLLAGVLGGALTASAVAEDHLPLLDPDVVPPDNEQIRGSENADLAVILAPFSVEGRSRAPATDTDRGLALIPLDSEQSAGLYHHGLPLQDAIGGELRDADGRAAGKVTAVLVSDGAPVALLARKGGFLGFGSREFVVPLSAVVADDSMPHNLRLALRGSQLALLPDYE